MTASAKRNAKPITDATAPRKEGMCHQPAAFSNAQLESHPARPNQTTKTSMSTHEVANPHQPRTFTSTMSAMSPPVAVKTPATDAKSMRRRSGTGCSVLTYDMLVT